MSGSSVREMMHALIESVEELYPQLPAAVLLLDREDNHLYNCASLNLPENYLKELDRIKVAPDVGTCATAVYRKERVVVEDTLTDPKWEQLREIAAKYNIRACWSQPIFSENREVLGTFALYADHPRVPSQDEIELMETVAEIAGMAIDMKDAEEALKKSEDRFRLLTQGVLDYAIYLEDTEGNITSWNQGGERIFGYTQDEILGKFFSILLPSEDIAAGLIEKELQTAISAGRYETEGWRYRKDGSRFWANVVLTPLYDAQGQHIGYANVTRDITERKMVEQALRESEERFRLILEGVNDGIWDWDLVQDVVYTNERYREMIGQKASSIESRKFFTLLIHSDDRARVQQAIRDHIERNVPYSIEFRLLNEQTGQYVTVLARGKAYKDETGKPIRMAGSHTDITERKRMEDALRASEARLRRIIDSSIIGVLFWRGFDGTITDANDAFLNMIEYTREDLNQGHLNWRKLTPTEYIGEDEKAIIQLEQYGIAHPFEKQYIRKDGSRADILVGAAYLDDLKEDGVAFLVDITERKQSERALQESEAKLRATMDMATDAIISIDADGSILFFNKAAEQIFGYASAEVLGRNVNMLMPSPYHEEHDQYLDNYRRTGVRKIIGIGREVVALRKDGTAFPIDLSVSEISQAQKQLFTGIIRDITKRKETERALQDSEVRFRTLANSVPAIVWTCLPSGEMNFISDRWTEYTGLTSEKSLGYCWMDAVHPEDRTQTRLLWLESVRTETDYEAEYRYRRHDGEYRWFLARAHPLRDEQGRITAWYGSSTDIQDFKLYQEALLNYQERLLNSNKELEGFATVASHDLQAPLRKIRSFADHVRSTSRDQLSPEALEDLERIQNASARMQDLVTDLLALSRINRKGQPFSETDLNDVLMLVQEELLPEVESTSASIEVSPLPTIEADGMQMHQLFQNLIENALKFHQKDVPPVIRVSAEILPNGYCRIAVADNGIGIKPEYFERIFEIFQRLHGVSAYPGTGIGLSICKRIVERHGGHISVESIPGRGTTFYVQLPVRQSLPSIRNLMSGSTSHS
ncbi:MAG TPA: PAS domain S-box protein [Coleofasciculaceae cyanobacterium]